MAWTVGEVRTYSYTGAVQSEMLDPGKYKFECWGGQGGGVAGGKGGYCVGEYEVIANSPVYIYVGEQPLGETGGWNGGGAGVPYYGVRPGGGGSDIRIGGMLVENRVIVAGGGGGRGSRDTRANGHGGGLIGVTADGSSPGTGGTQSSGGLAGGVLFSGGRTSYMAGGGGGGYYGGGAGQDHYGGGGGGSSYYGTLTNASTTAGVKVGNGEVKITMLSASSSSRRFCQII